ncbi:hypothetical protein [Gynuella sunshinyii]|uniref:Uncharacterized protein n=1 Tax=Gynuella sunshinyii YC6258 TaxID=1445510 RepID=A0A0C5VUW5_9GAMM|nr:hypothetical protein [Gynuella sunshinyii]AJQ97926.1 hypothetical Protein YC6258_05900 [Gynuella sunshinyii YC6258]
MVDINTTPAELEEGLKVKAGVRTTITVSARELCLLVGAENYYNSYALKMMFFAPAVRDIRRARDEYDHFRLIYFNHGYNNEEIKQVQTSLKDIDVTMVAVTNIDEMLTELNQKSPVCKIQRLNIYAHGIPLEISFNYHSDSEEKCSLSMQHISKIDKTIFCADAVIWSYACRTGNGAKGLWNEVSQEFTYPGTTADDSADIEKSLAQAMANQTDRPVYAWLTRTLYEYIWDDQGDQSYRKTFIDIPHPGTDGGWKRELKDLIPFSEEDDKDDLVLWNKQGAKRGVVGGNTPHGLSNSPHKFTKK